MKCDQKHPICVQTMGVGMVTEDVVTGTIKAMGRAIEVVGTITAVVADIKTSVAATDLNTVKSSF